MNSKETAEIVTDEEITQVWENADFGDVPKRWIISEALKHITKGYRPSHTATCIVKQLGLVYVKDEYLFLTDKGFSYLSAEYRSIGEREAAIGFAEWVDNGYLRNVNGLWEDYKNSGNPMKTTEQLYEIYEIYAKSLLNQQGEETKLNP